MRKLTKFPFTRNIVDDESNFPVKKVKFTLNGYFRRLRLVQLLFPTFQTLFNTKMFQYGLPMRQLKRVRLYPHKNSLKAGPNVK